MGDEAEANFLHQKRVNNIDQENHQALVESMRTELLKISTEKNETKSKLRHITECFREKESLANKLQSLLNESKANNSGLEMVVREKEKKFDELERLVKNMAIESERKMMEQEKDYEVLLRKQARKSFEKEEISFSRSYNSHDSIKRMESLQDEVNSLRSERSKFENSQIWIFHSEE